MAWPGLDAGGGAFRHRLANVQRSIRNGRYVPGLDEFRARRVVDGFRYK
jgi:hypothetical protein